MARRRNTRVVRGNRTARTDVAGSLRRLRVGRLLLVAALVVAGAKLVIVQGFEASALSERAREQLATPEVIPAERGSIVDSNGRVLAFSTEARQLYASLVTLEEKVSRAHAKNPDKPTVEEYKRDAAAYIGRVTHGKVSEQQVLDALFSDNGFLYFGPLIDPGTAHRITEEYTHIGAEYRAVRQYPAGSVAANILGAATWRKEERKIRGLLGLENTLDPVLAGEDGTKISSTAQGSSSLVIPGSKKILKPVQPGSDVRLTIDSDLQYVLQQKLADYVAEMGAEGGSAVVLDAQTGQVRALANDKTFDPGDQDTWTDEKLGNPAVTTPFEPGSVNKVITAAGAIEHGIVEPDTVLQVPGQIAMGGSTIDDAWSHGTIPLTFTGVLAKSSNVGTLMTAQKLGKDRFSALMERFGLGRKTGIALPGESSGRVPPRKQWSGTTFANLPIGQGLSMTVLQMAGMYQAIANDGVRIPPRIIAGKVKPDGTRVPHPRPEGVRVVSEQTADTVKDMLRATVQDVPGQEGTAPEADLKGYRIAGKTGTAQQVDPSCGCYSNSKYWTTFAGIVPADDPRYVVGIMLDNPTKTRSAAPLFHDIASYLTQRYGIPLSKKPAPEVTLRVR
ncbi:peptidoglycan D,D-transpeptidase FtsI family protein [Haloactinomyces albus]|uniref:Cell division protein FtsI (Penicillin-binding protein 3) n=1 Tax=Haloactinomyces albus TaxID=1352928 RepID=A0AAE4CM37_9ACTN|nr:penicillin-binding protein 2 [Haloactinomyces albus]MDR7300582.1 cell division protein FtsI (penicillin-binding protein 3) [Haloactinomyces albus]